MDCTINNDGIGATYATFNTKDLVEQDVGKAVCLTDSNTVSEGFFGKPILGRLEFVKGSICTVQIMGITKFLLDPLETVPMIYLYNTYIVTCGSRGMARVIVDNGVQRGSKFLGITEDGYVSVLL